MEINHAFLRNKLEYLGIKQVEFAKEAGISPSRICLILGGWSQVGISTIKKLTHAMNAIGMTNDEILVVVSQDDMKGDKK